jgi:hypothetical protein
VQLRPSYLSVFLFVSLQLIITNSLADEALAEPAEGHALSPQDQAMQQVREELGNLEKRWYGLTRLKWGFPLRFSAGFGAMLVEQPSETDCATGCMVRGWHFEVEPGQYGIQGSVGWGKLVGETGRTKRWLHTVNWGWAVRGSVLRTWRYGPMGPIPQTLVGIEGNLSIVRLNFSAGIMRSLSSQTDDDWVVIGAVGVGF